MEPVRASVTRRPRQNPARQTVAEHLADRQAWLWRICDAWTYQAIADALGWQSRSAAYRAVWWYSARRLEAERQAPAPNPVEERQLDALEMRLTWEDADGRPPTYQFIADSLGYAHRTSARKACGRGLERLWLEDERAAFWDSLRPGLEPVMNAAAWPSLRHGGRHRVTIGSPPRVAGTRSPITFPSKTSTDCRVSPHTTRDGLSAGYRLQCWSESDGTDDRRQ